MVELVSSWIAFGSRCIMVLVVGFFSVLKPKLVESATRTKPSQTWNAGLGAFGDGLQLLPAAKLVP